MTRDVSDKADESNQIQRRLEALDHERLQLQTRLDQLQKAKIDASRVRSSHPSVTNSSSAVDKIALFRRLFGGRTDVFPMRWDNPKTGRSGYAPACANEWVRGVCGKPQVKCGDCPNKAFIPVTPDVIECHLRGEDRVRPNGRGKDFVAGVYPLFFDDTCGFLAVDFDEEDWSSDALAFVAAAVNARCRSRWNGRVQGTAVTSGCSSPSPSRHRTRAVSGHCC